MPVSQLGVLKLDGSQKGVFNSAQIGKGLFHSFLGPRGEWVLKQAIQLHWGFPMQVKQETNKGSIPGQQDPLE